MSNSKWLQGIKSDYNYSKHFFNQKKNFSAIQKLITQNDSKFIISQNYYYFKTKKFLQRIFLVYQEKKGGNLCLSTRSSPLNFTGGQYCYATLFTATFGLLCIIQLVIFNFFQRLQHRHCATCHSFLSCQCNKMLMMKLPITISYKSFWKCFCFTWYTWQAETILPWQLKFLKPVVLIYCYKNWILILIIVIHIDQHFNALGFDVILNRPKNKSSSGVHFTLLQLEMDKFCHKNICLLEDEREFWTVKIHKNLSIVFAKSSLTREKERSWV